ncbi:hypothetical protein D9M69_591130 [compost metagenome]
MLLHGQRVVAAAFHRGIVGEDHALDAFDAADPGDHAGGRHVFAVHLVGGELADFEERRAGVEQTVDAFARQQLAARGMALLGLGAAALVDAGEQGAQVVDLLEHGGRVGGEVRRARVDLGVQDGHGAGSVCLLLGPRVRGDDGSAFAGVTGPLPGAVIVPRCHSRARGNPINASR